MDLVLLALVVGFFLLTFGFLRLCSKLDTTK